MTETAIKAAESPIVRLGRISFINVDPVYYGIEHGSIPGEIRLVRAPPAELNRRMASGMLDISAVSSAAYGNHHKEWLLLPGLSVACRGDVLSVLLVSRVSLEQLDCRRVLFSDESATAAALTRLLFAYKNISPELVTTRVSDPSHVGADAAAALVIGDASLRHNWRKDFNFVWDLGDLWARHAGLPFVFAVWAVRREFASAYPETVSRTINALSESKRIGLRHLDAVIQSGSEKLNIDIAITRRYFENFCFDFNNQEKAGLQTFFYDLHLTGILPEEVRLSFFDGL